jgi:hypothetical protein
MKHQMMFFARGVTCGVFGSSGSAFFHLSQSILLKKACQRDCGEAAACLSQKTDAGWKLSNGVACYSFVRSIN